MALYDRINETTSDQADYIVAASAGAVAVMDANVGFEEPPAGTDLRIDYDTRYQGGSAIQVEILEGSTVIKSQVLDDGVGFFLITAAEWAAVATWPWTPRFRVTATTAAPPLPSWVPAAGEVVTYTKGGGVLTNSLYEVTNPNAVGYTAFYSIKIVQYSGQILHPTWRNYGGRIFAGGGHSATNNNVVIIQTFDADTIYYECVVAPTNWSVADDQGNVTSELNLTYGEVTGSSPLQLASAHRYGLGNVVDGKLIQPASVAWGNINAGSAQAAHELDLSNPATSYNSRGWVRRTSSTGSWAWFNAAMLDRYVPAHNRTYFVARGPGGPYSPLWFDHATNAWVTGTGTGFNYVDYGIESGGLMHVPSRDLLVLAARNGSGNVVIEWMNVASGITQPTLGGTPTLSATLAVPAEWGAVSWCEDSQRILVFGVTSNTDKVYEIAIPTTLTDTWTVDSYTLSGGQTISPLTSANCGAYGKSFDYNPLTKCIVFQTSLPTEAGNDSIRVYRPRNT